MLAAAAMSTCSCESSVVEFPIGAVWAAVRSLKFEWCAALSGDGVEPSGESGAIAKTVVARSARRHLHGRKLSRVRGCAAFWRSGLAAQADRQGRSCLDSEGAPRRSNAPTPPY